MEIVVNVGNLDGSNMERQVGYLMNFVIIVVMRVCNWEDNVE